MRSSFRLTLTGVLAICRLDVDLKQLVGNLLEALVRLSLTVYWPVYIWREKNRNEPKLYIHIVIFFPVTFS